MTRTDGHCQGNLAAAMHMDGVCCCTWAAWDILGMDPREQDRWLREIAATPAELERLRVALAKDMPEYRRITGQALG